MSAGAGLTTARILAVFADQVATHLGHVSDSFDDGQRLFVRSVLPRMEVLRPGDRLQAGVALRANQQEVWLHPYVFRLVCRNGAIFARTLATRHLDNLRSRKPEETVRFLRDSVESCCAKDVFTQSVDRMRSACESKSTLDIALMLMPLLSLHSSQTDVRLLLDIAERFSRDGDSSRFGLISAVTSVARDTRDPETRWNLEELGGGIAIGKIPGPLPDRTTSATAKCGDAMSIG